VGAPDVAGDPLVRVVDQRAGLDLVERAVTKVVVGHSPGQPLSPLQSQLALRARMQMVL